MNFKRRKIFFIVNAPDFFISHRLPLAQAARKSGFDVHIITARGPGVEYIKKLGFTHHAIPITRSGQKPAQEIYTLFYLFRLIFRLKPSLVHLVTIKPVIYGGIAARFFRETAVVSAVSGLGTVFLADSFTKKIRRFLVSSLYRYAFKLKRLRVVFQNSDDQKVLTSIKAVDFEKTRLIRGSGVSIEDYPYLPEPTGIPIVVMAARLLRDKGVYEYVKAAELLKERGVPVEMRLIGSPDTGNPTSVTQENIALWANKDAVELLGYRSDIAKQYAQANIACLPSYREGLPKSLVEAAACGRAVVTTDVPGCRDAIEPGKTGVLVPVKDPVALADAIQDLIENPDKRQAMGKAGRELAEREFAIEKIVQQHMDIYQELLDAE